MHNYIRLVFNCTLCYIRLVPHQSAWDTLKTYIHLKLDIRDIGSSEKEKQLFWHKKWKNLEKITFKWENIQEKYTSDEMVCIYKLWLLASHLTLVYFTTDFYHRIILPPEDYSITGFMLWLDSIFFDFNL